jgi:hypothetical protein
MTLQAPGERAGSPQNVRARSHLRGKRLSWAHTMICVSRGPAFGPCGWPNASGGERMAAAPALEHFALRQTRSNGPSSDLLPTLERPSVSRDLLAVSPHARSPLGHPLGVLPAPLGLELLVVFSEPSLVPGGPAASRRNADLAALPRPAPASVDERFAAGCAGRAQQPISGSIRFSEVGPRISTVSFAKYFSTAGAVPSARRDHSVNSS